MHGTQPLFNIQVPLLVLFSEASYLTSHAPLNEATVILLLKPQTILSVRKVSLFTLCIMTLYEFQF